MTALSPVTKLAEKAASPWEADGLAERVEFLRLDASRRLDPARRSEMGQFLTPAPVAELIASMFANRPSSVRFLDAGAGVGSLTAALVTHLIRQKLKPRVFEIKSSRKKLRPDFSGFFFALTGAEVLVAQSLRKQFTFVLVNTGTGDHIEISLSGIFSRAKGIYPTWSICF
jgi:hypothetical protein